MLNIDDWTITEILTMHEEGKTLVEIEARTGIDDSTLPKIIKYPDKYRSANCSVPRLFTNHSLHTGHSEKCLGCGYMVYMPCQICLAREYRKLHRMKI